VDRRADHDGGARHQCQCDSQSVSPGRGYLMILSRLVRIGTSRIEPRIKLGRVREHRAELPMLMAVNRETLLLLPAIKRPDTPVEVARNLLPGIQTLPELSRFDCRIRAELRIHQ